MRSFARAVAIVAATTLAVPAHVGAQSAVAAPAAAPAAQAPEAKAAKGPKRDQGIPEHFDGIALTDEQKTKIRELHHLYHTQMTQIKVTSKKKNEEGHTLPMSPKVMKQLDDLEAREMTEFRTVLNPEQVALFEKNLAKEKAEAAKKAEEAKKAANP